MQYTKLHIVILIFTSTILTSGCNLGHESENGSTSPPYFIGSFIQEFLVKDWDDERWDMEMRLLKEAGMGYLIYAPSLLIDMNGNISTNYPSSLFISQQPNFSLEKCLRSAQKNDMKIFIGLNFNERWWKVDYDATWLVKQMEIGNSVADELIILYKEKYPDAMYGWYWVWEVDNLHWMTTECNEKLAQCLNTNLDHLSKVTPNMPLMMSPFMNHKVGGDSEQYKDMWKKVFAKTNFREGDIFAPQDCIGTEGLNFDNLDQWFSKLKEAVDSKPGLQFWGNVEIFEQRYWVSASLSRVQKQLKIVNKYANKIICFAYSHYYSPYVVSKQYHKSYLDYLKNGELKAESPEKIRNASLRENTQGIEISWDKNPDSGSTVGYCVYRDGTLLTKIQENEKNTIIKYLDPEGKKINAYDISSYNVLGIESEKTRASFVSEDIESAVTKAIETIPKKSDFYRRF